MVSCHLVRMLLTVAEVFFRQILMCVVLQLLYFFGKNRSLVLGRSGLDFSSDLDRECACHSNPHNVRR